MSIAWRPTLIVTSLLLILTYLWMRSTNPELERGSRLQATLRIIELRDAELTRDLLMARAGLLPNYDALTKAGQELIRLSRILEEELKPTDKETDRGLTKSVASLVNALRLKLDHIEYFKSDNALLRNSVMYFDVIGKNLRGRTKTGATAKLGNLWQSMLGFMESPDPDSAQKINQELDHISKVKSFAGYNKDLIVHGRLIVEVLPKLDSLLREIIGYPIVGHIDELQVAFSRYSEEVEARAQAYRLMLYLVALVLLGYLIFQFARLRANTLALRRAHSTLQQETSERLQAEALLRESEERLRTITESAHEAIVSADSRGLIVSWNRGATVMFGYSPDEALGSPLLRLLAGHRLVIKELLMGEGRDPLLLNSPGAATELTGLRRDRSEFPLELSFSSWTRGVERYMTAIMRDISVRKRLEETARQQEIKLIQANKMTALGMLVSGVAHEINNPNQLILMNAGLLADAWGDAVEALEDRHRESGEFLLAGLPYPEMRKTLPLLIHDIKDAAKRIQGIVADLMNYARPQGMNPQTLFSVNEVVERAVRLLNHLIVRKTKHFRSDLMEPLALLRGDPQQVEQVVVNLLVNALEALPDQGCGVTISTRAVNDGLDIGLEVRDEGVGIDPEHLEQLCDPFFTTKQASGGTGLGLAISSSLVQAHGGSLSFSSIPGEGTCVRATFPRAPY